MNKLGDLQKRLYDPDLSAEEYAARKKEFLDSYYSLRKKTETNIWGCMSFKTKKLIHPLILGIYKAKNRLGGFSFTVIKDERKTTQNPIIFAVTHVGKFDIELVSEAIKEHYYLLSGDFEHIQGILDEPFLNLNGVLYFNEKDKKDRREVSERMVGLLKQGANILYFPEGTWNLSPNLPVLPCYWGIIDVARRGMADIVPIGAEQYGKHFDIAIGANIDISDYGEGDKEKARAITDLRNVLATLKWDIWEKHQARRKDIPEDWYAKWCEARFREWSYFSLNYVDELVYKPKGIINSDEAFAFMNKLIPCRENAFLFKKRL